MYQFSLSILSVPRCEVSLLFVVALPFTLYSKLQHFNRCCNQCVRVYLCPPTSSPLPPNRNTTHCAKIFACALINVKNNRYCNIEHRSNRIFPSISIDLHTSLFQSRKVIRKTIASVAINSKRAKIDTR